MEKHGIESGGGTEGRTVRQTRWKVSKKSPARQRFLGYEASKSPTPRWSASSHDNWCDRIDEVDHEQPIVVVLDKTRSTAKMGGQVGDHGEKSPLPVST